MSGWIQTFTGRQFFPLAPRAEDIDIHDIAHALSMTCRFAGHCREFYSVAEHSCIVCAYAEPEYELWALLHDASEAYLADIPRPVKPSLVGYAEAEERVMRAVAERFDLPWPMPEEVKDLDTRVLMDEHEHLFDNDPAPWGVDVQPLGVRLVCAPPAKAEAAFLRLFDMCRGRR